MSADTAKANFLQQFLRDSDAPCPSCGYNLRGLSGQRCPECGEEITVQVGLVDPKIAGAITGLIGLAAGAGLNGLLLVYGTIRILVMQDRMHDMERFFLLIIPGFIIEAAAMGFWLGYWRAIRRQRPRFKAILVVAAWCLTLLDIVVFSVKLK